MRVCERVDEGVCLACVTVQPLMLHWAQGLRLYRSTWIIQRLLEAGAPTKAGAVQVLGAEGWGACTTTAETLLTCYSPHSGVRPAVRHVIQVVRRPNGSVSWLYHLTHHVIQPLCVPEARDGCPHALFLQIPYFCLAFTNPTHHVCHFGLELTEKLWHEKVVCSLAFQQPRV